MNDIEQETLRNDIAIMQAFGVLLHHVGNLQALVDKIPGAVLSRDDVLAASAERILMIEELSARCDAVRRVTQSEEQQQ